MIDIERIQKDFPQFESNPNLVYLDSAASSLTPTPVLTAVEEYYKTYRANIHRGLYKEAEKASTAYEEARKKVARLIRADTDEIIFTAGATMSANMLVYALEQSLSLAKDDEVVTTTMEHHAMLLPLQGLVQRNKLTLHSIDIDGSVLKDADIDSCITKRTKIVSVILASNVLGTVNDVARIAKKAHEVGAYVLVDATAAVGHVPIDVKTLGADALFFSGHKMCAPTGVGVLYGTRNFLEQLRPSIVGGGIVSDVTETTAEWNEIPNRFEAGTQNIGGVIGLGAAVEYLEEVGIENIHAHSKTMTTYIQQELKKIDGVKVYSGAPEQNVGIVSFTVSDIHAHDVAEIAGRNSVALRAGHHCALPLHKAIAEPATTRASVYLYNAEADIDALVESVKEAKSIFNT